MPRLLILLLVAVVAAGCYQAQPQPMQNPFFSQTTVPPPGTGTSQTLAPPPSSYYQPPANVPYTAPPQSAAPGMQGSAPGYAPPAGSYVAPQTYPQGAYARPQPYVASTVDRAAGAQVTNTEGWRVPAPSTRRIQATSSTVVARPANGVGIEEFSTTARSAPARAAAQVASSSGYSAARIEPRHGEPIRIVEPEASAVVRQAVVEAPVEPREPARFRPAGDLIEISELPEVRRTTVEESSEVRQAVYEAADVGRRPSVYAVASTVSAARSQNAAELDGRYGVDPEYRWLRGRLAFDESTGQWRLDYVAPQAPVDEFGGSVMLVESPLLDNLASGDYVIVHGVLDDESIELDAPPSYFVEQVSRTAE